MKIRGNMVFAASFLLMSLLFNKQANMASLNSCFISSGASLIKYETEGSAILKTDDTPEMAAFKMLKSFGSSAATAGCWNEGMYIVNISDSQTSITIKTKKINNKKEIYASMSVSQYNGSMNINNVWNMIGEAFLQYNAKPSYLSLISGKYDFRHSKDEMNRKIEEIFYNNNIRAVDKMSEKNMTSVCGYMDNINSYILDNNQKINVNIALRYSETYGCTYITIGSPVISAEY